MGNGFPRRKPSLGEGESLPGVTVDVPRHFACDLVSCLGSTVEYLQHFVSPDRDDLLTGQPAPLNWRIGSDDRGGPS